LPQTSDLKDAAKALSSFVGYAAGRYAENRCRLIAASLSFTSLLALVPFMAIVFAVLAQVPMLEGFRHELQDFIFANLMPDTGGKVGEYFDGFIASAGKMKRFGVIGLIVVAMMLLNTVFKEMNIIFRVERPRPIPLRVAVYLGVLVMGPLILASSFSLATYLFTLTKGMGVDAFGGPLGHLTRAVPAIILICGFSLFYKVVPNRHVAWADALVGGCFSGLAFSGLRYLFGLYIIYVPTYQVIYGALATVPVFMVWMFLSWSVVLLGAVIAASLADWRRLRADGTQA